MSTKPLLGAPAPSALAPVKPSLGRELLNQKKTLVVAALAIALLGASFALSGHKAFTATVVTSSFLLLGAVYKLLLVAAEHSLFVNPQQV